MASEIIELRGHILDSLTLPKVMDEIVARQGRFKLLDLQIGQLAENASLAVLEVSAPSQEVLSEILTRLQMQGAVVRDVGFARLEPAPADGVFPESFYVTSNHPTRVRLPEGDLPVRPERMDCGIVVTADAARSVKFAQVRAGDRVVVGHAGVIVSPEGEPASSRRAFEFMASEVSTEKPKSAAIAEIAAGLRETRERGERILVVAGPAVIHTGAGPHLERLIRRGYVDLLFAGNALAVHDIEQALFQTALGIHLGSGAPVERGHQNHLHAINRIRAAGSIRAAVESGLLAGGVMHACIERGVEFVLAGSVRDDGPLPEVITDILEAQQAMAARLEGVGYCLMLATMLHSIATGNLLPASCRIACVDINPVVVTKLADRGSFQAVGVVTDVEPFFVELLGRLAAE